MWEVIQATVIASVLFVLIMTFGVIMLRMVKRVYLDIKNDIKNVCLVIKNDCDALSKASEEDFSKTAEELEQERIKWEQERIAERQIADLEQAARNGDLIAYDEWKRLTERN